MADTIKLPALPAGQIYIPCVQADPVTFCKYNGEVDKAYALSLANLNGETVQKALSAFWTRTMGTVTIPEGGYPEGETRLSHCDSRAEAVNANTYGFGSGGGAKGDLATVILRATVVEIVMHNLPAYSKRKTEAVKAVREDCAGLFRKCCASQAPHLDGETEESLFDKFWPKHEAESKAEAKRQQEMKSKAKNAFDLGDFAPSSD